MKGLARKIAAKTAETFTGVFSGKYSLSMQNNGT